MLAVTATAREAEDLAAALGSLLRPRRVGYFPAWETLPHERLSPRSDTSGQRLAVLRRLAHPDPSDPRTGPLLVVAAPVRSLLQPMVGGLGELEPVALAPGQEAEPRGQSSTQLVEIGYARVDLVEKRGEFAVRGGILDVFPPTEEHPLRVEFLGDEVEEIRYFKVADQRSLEIAEDGLWAPPCRELLLTPAVRARARQLAASGPGCGEMLGKMAEGITVEGMEALAPALTDRMELLLDYLPAAARSSPATPSGSGPARPTWSATSQEFLEASWVNAAAGGEVPIDLGAAAFRPIAEVAGAGRRRWSCRGGRSPRSPPPGCGRRQWRGGRRRQRRPAASEGDGRSFPITAEPGTRLPRRYRAGARRRPAVAGRRAGGSCWSPRATGRRSGWPSCCAAEGLGAHGDGDLAEPPEPGLAHVATGLLESGFVWPSVRLAVLTEADLAGQRTGTRQSHRMPSRRRGGIDPLQLTPGDYIVHEQHGVGRYLEMTSRTVQGATRDYLVIEYAPSKRGQPADRLYLPTDQLDQVTRYTGGEAPALHRLGGADWAKAKGRARKAVKDIAAGLIRLYQARMASPGHAFGPDTPWQRELEDAFPYVETPDQLAAVDEVKADMERAVPMDRLICGDVGYGKTEIAVRAAFKAVQDGKQVAVLVPTTLLSAQHFATFSERYAPFPVTVRPMSRFQSRQGGGRDAGRPGRGQGRRGHRHAPAAVARGQVRPARAGDHRRGAAVRRRAQGVPQAAAHRGRRADHVGHADPAHAGDGHHRHPGDVHHPDPARGAPPGADLRRARTTRSRSRPPSGASCCATARCSSSTTGSRRSTGWRPGWPSWCPRPGSASATAR